jgi:hypothetical protein
MDHMWTSLPMELQGKIIDHVFEQDKADLKSIKSLLQASSLFKNFILKSLSESVNLIFTNLKTLEIKTKKALDDCEKNAKQSFSVIPFDTEWDLLNRLSALKTTLIPYPLDIKTISSLKSKDQFVLAIAIKNEIEKNQKNLNAIFELQREIGNGQRG